MRACCYFFIVLSCLPSLTLAQLRDSRTHQRGLLHQTVYNTGEIGRRFDNGVSGILHGTSSLEWPPNSSLVLDRTVYAGQHNSFGGGLWLAGTRPSGRQYMLCGAVTDATGNPITVEGIYSIPLSIERIENYPLLPNGNLNPLYNPDEAEEKIVAQWTTPLGVAVSRTSRAWSFPGYDSFIIYEYELNNTTADTIMDLDVVWAYGLAPSMFGYQRTYSRWAEGDYRGQNGEGSQFGRVDLKRWMTYNHDREGRPDTQYFDMWSTPGNRGGLNSPQAAGLMMLYYDYDHIATRTQTHQVWPSVNDSAGIWDSNGRVKQPFLLRFENGNIPQSKTAAWLDPGVQRKTGVFVGPGDSTRLVTQFLPSDVNNWFYWRGRTKGTPTLSWYQPVVRAFGFYPYVLPPGATLRFAVAEVVGYGAGVVGDRIYSDLGGNTRAGVEAGGIYFNPVPSLYDTLQYPYLGSTTYIGSRYLQTHPLPWYVTPGVVSIRDVADRAIQTYSGLPLTKYDSLQYEPVNSRPNGFGAYNTIPIPVPAPAIAVHSGFDSVNQRIYNTISWGPQVEAFSAPRLRAPFARYSVLRAPEPLGPWLQIDTVGRRDPRYFRDSLYVFRDDSVANEYTTYYYAVLSVDALGGKSGMTNMTEHVWTTDVGESGPTTGSFQFSLEQNYPNPFNPTTRIKYSVPSRSSDIAGGRVGAHVTLRVYDILGREVATLVNEQMNPGGYVVTFDGSHLASGVYFYRLQAGGLAETRRFLLLR